MLTRLRVNGFKNLVDVDLCFGPFTCIAGANAVGKSNLFDAIGFLSDLAERPLLDAALAVRGEGGGAADVRNLFHRVGDTAADEMSFEADILIPHEGVDELGQRARASSTLLRYGLTLGYAEEQGTRSLVLLREELAPLDATQGDAHLPFPHSPAWRKSVLKARRGPAGAKPLIETVGSGSQRGIRLNSERRAGSALTHVFVDFHPSKTLLSTATLADRPTVFLARRELLAWRRLQLDPAALRRPDELTASAELGHDGSHLAALLYDLAERRPPDAHDGVALDEATARVYARVANRLWQVNENVRSVSVERDEKRQLLTLMVTDRDGTTHSARSLSDGTLRFLALAVLSEDLTAHDLLCVEEPENGIHPERIPAVIDVLREIATATDGPVDADNPLRQVIVNTHSPTVVLQVPEDSLVVAEQAEVCGQGGRFRAPRFGGLATTWRERVSGRRGASLASILAYLNPVEATEAQEVGLGKSGNGAVAQRVVDRPDVEQLLPQLGVNA